MTAKFITAPDKISTDSTTQTRILIVDAEWHDVETIALLCMTRQMKYDFYLFGPTSINIEWLNHAAGTADVILINNVNTGRHVDIKNNLSKLKKAKSLGTPSDKFKLPLDYLVTQLEEV